MHPHQVVVSVHSSKSWCWLISVIQIIEMATGIHSHHELATEIHQHHLLAPGIHPNQGVGSRYSSKSRNFLSLRRSFQFSPQFPTFQLLLSHNEAKNDVCLFLVVNSFLCVLASVKTFLLLILAVKGIISLLLLHHNPGAARVYLSRLLIVRHHNIMQELLF